MNEHPEFMPPLGENEALFSQQQLDWIVKQTKRTAERAARDAAQRVRNRAVVGFLILLLGLGVVTYEDRRHAAEARESIVSSGDVVAVDSCNRDYITIDALRDGLENNLIRINALEADGTYSARQAASSREITTELLDRYTLPDCRLAEKMLSDDPDASPRLPVPRYPDDPLQLRSEAREKERKERK